MLLLMVGNEKCDGEIAFSDIMYVRLMKVWWYVQKLKWGTYLQMPTLHRFLLLHH